MNNSTQISGFEQHNHSHCIDNALQEARELCQKKALRLTPLREQVLTFVWQSHKPLGAYAILDMLADANNNAKRRVAPPTVYRALDFLQECGLVHRIASLNAYIGCCSPSQHHQSHFFICRQCGSAAELATTAISQAINQAALQTGFSVETECVEVVGLCPQCQGSQPPVPNETDGSQPAEEGDHA